ncbi:9577_t:CDS:2 [Ambispora leptoticha]|uniref:9577_t:CDS:1 n=1 Tax=Ambispora leptoticha TaxID=144679 RepID=A0A9N9HT42_9GLOM|nr:9577_t:CDS:2 [Ambispora leptoticha]
MNLEFENRYRRRKNQNARHLGIIYWTYPGVNICHPWQSIRSHAINFIMTNLLPERSVVANMANERTSASTTPIVNEQEQLHKKIMPSPNATPTRIEICEFQGQGNAPTSSTSQLSDKRELREHNAISIQSAPGSVTLIQSEPGSVYCTPLK